MRLLSLQGEPWGTPLLSLQGCPRVQEEGEPREDRPSHTLGGMQQRSPLLLVGSLDK